MLFYFIVIIVAAPKLLPVGQSKNVGLNLNSHSVGGS
jgi:hypothetical protein